VKVTNPDGQSATATGLLTTVPRPVAADDSGYTVPQDGTLDATTSVLANDSDPRSEPLTAQQATAPAHGALTLRPDGTFTYVPAAGYSGTDSFTYRAVDSETSSHPATVTVTVQARSPTTTTATTTTDQTPAPVLSPVTPAAPAAPPAAPVRCVVPRLKGKTVAQARRLLTKAHCRAGKITRVSTKKVRRHRVLSTRPSAATRHAKGTVVKLTVRR
jgi:VCBS repeat-containing protein